MAEVTPEEVLMADRAAVPVTPVGRFALMMGGVASVALTLGIAVWGYKTIARDVSGVPIVAALEGPMRVAPENPGGDLALHTGLSVNDVAAQGGAAAPEDRLVLAPRAVDVTAEDVRVEAAAPDAAVQAAVIDVVAEAVAETPIEQADNVQNVSFDATTRADPNAPLNADEILALADQIAAGASEMAPAQARDVVPAVVSVAGQQVETAIQVIPASVPGVRQSVRPQLRPQAGLVQASVQTNSQTTQLANAGGATQIRLMAQDMPTGTKLAQLGAFDSAEIATSEWNRLQAQFSEFMHGHEPFIQQATSGGRTFYRLRVSGFNDLSDARRFCSALMSENAPCIPVVVR